MEKLKHIGLFEGIGGFSEAAEWAGWETVAWCEWNWFGQYILSNKYPNAEGFGDIKKTDFTKYANRIDVLTGGFPCQPYSTAGKRKGKDDERHLWPEMLRAIREIQPPWVVGENVRGLTNWNGGMVFNEVQVDLEAEGYEVLPFLLPACAKNAPHRRDRIWFIAYNESARIKKTSSDRDGQSWINGKNEIITDKRWNHAFSDIINGPINGDSSNPDSTSTKHPIQARGNESASENEQNDVANTTGGGTGILQNESGKEGPQISDFILRNSGGFSAKSTSSDPNGFRLRNESERGAKSRIIDENGKKYDWANFPIESPVRDGNDGFSTESLRQRIRKDSLGLLSEKEINSIISKAATKWREETIKAGGNAIVPQVFYEIAKAINTYMEQNPIELI